MKYIILQTSDPLPRTFPVIFPNELVHSLVAESLIKNHEGLNKATVVGAGEISCLDIDPKCTGAPTSLGVKSRGILDDACFKMRDYTGGIEC